MKWFLFILGEEGSISNPIELDFGEQLDIMISYHSDKGYFTEENKRMEENDIESLKTETFESQGMWWLVKYSHLKGKFSSLFTEQPTLETDIAEEGES